MTETLRRPTTQDLTGQRFGKILVMEFDSYRKNRPFWKCQCDCGTVWVVRAGALQKSRNTSSCKPCSKTKDLTGQRFGKIVVLGFGGYKGQFNKKHGRKARWKCKCDCGHTWIVNANSLLKKNGTKSCGPCAYRRLGDVLIEKSKSKNSKHVGCWYLGNVRISAKKRGHEYRITLQDAEDQWVKQNGRCALTDIKLTPTCDSSHSTVPQNNTASLDRIDSSKKIYIAGNIQWIHKDVNFMKHTFSEEYLIEMSTLIVEKAKRDRQRH